MLLNQKQLSQKIEVDPNQLRRESTRPGFPVRIVDGKKRFIESEVLAWRSANVRQRKAGPAAPPALERAFVSTALANDDDPFILAMMSGQATALDINRAAMQMASRRVAKAAVAGTLSANDLDGLKKTLQELRAAEAGYIELEESKRGLIQRSEVMAIISMAVSRLVQVLGVLENAIATEFAMWLVDPVIREMPTDQRSRVVREFVAKTTADVRRLEADGVEKMLDVRDEE